MTADTVCDRWLNVAVICVATVRETGVVVIGNVAVLEPAGIVTLAGKLTYGLPVALGSLES